MNCPNCKQEMKRFGPEQTYLASWKPDYICSKCGIIVRIIKSQDASGNDTIVVTHIEHKDATG